MKYEYVITAGPGTLVELGVADDLDMDDVCHAAIVYSYSIQAEPCAEDCETGQ